MREEVDAWVDGGGRRPGLATVLVGDDPASAVYVAGKQRACAEVGIEGFDHRAAGRRSHEQQVVELLGELERRPGASAGSCCSCRPRTTSTVRG